ncbi:hypothetical protein HK100_010967 [Physocladia obscura]|uniref:Uncharacterized protein n=1 Tax=Physocladia obscura TaxID=109957 RepID=A0AAD5XEG6_9FUNG|nr:hypothetical protein HK100_010967 [Physocladia obscura]
MSTYTTPDGNTPPMIMNPSIDTPENQASIAIVIGLFVSVFPIFYVFQIVVNRWLLGEEKWAKSISDSAASVQVISSNFRLVLQHLVSIPTRKEVISSNGTVLIPWVYFSGLVISFIVIQNAIGTSMLGAGFVIKITQAQAGLILFFISCNSFLVSRILEYYKEKTEIRKKAAAYAFKVANEKRTKQPSSVNQVQPIEIPANVFENQENDSELPKLEEILVNSANRVDSELATTVSEIDINPLNLNPPQNQQLAIFNSTFEYNRRLKHILPQYNRIQATFGNAMQILVLVIEFIQLASFPYRDLLENSNFQESLSYDAEGQIDTLGNNFISFIRTLSTAISSGLPSIDTLVLTNIRFAIAWWISLIGVIVAATFMFVKKNLHSNTMRAYPKVRKVCKIMVEGTWITYFEPLTSIFYLILLGSFIEPLGCISSSNQPLWPPELGSTVEQSYINKENAIELREEQCAPVLLNPPLQVWFTLIGYIMGKLEKESTKPRTGITYSYNLKDDEDGAMTNIANKAVEAISKAFRFATYTLGLSVQPPSQAATAASSSAAYSSPITIEPRGTIKSNNSEQSEAKSAFSSVSISSDRSAAYNSSLRAKLQGPRAPANQSLASHAEIFISPRLTKNDNSNNSDYKQQPPRLSESEKMPSGTVTYEPVAFNSRLRSTSTGNIPQPRPRPRSVAENMMTTGNRSLPLTALNLPPRPYSIEGESFLPQFNENFETAEADETEEKLELKRPEQLAKKKAISKKKFEIDKAHLATFSESTDNRLQTPSVSNFFLPEESVVRLEKDEFTHEKNNIHCQRSIANDEKIGTEQTSATMKGKVKGPREFKI